MPEKTTGSPCAFCLSSDENVQVLLGEMKPGDFSKFLKTTALFAVSRVVKNGQPKQRVNLAYAARVLPLCRPNLPPRPFYSDSGQIWDWQQACSRVFHACASGAGQVSLMAQEIRSFYRGLAADAQEVDGRLYMPIYNPKIRQPLGTLGAIGLGNRTAGWDNYERIRLSRGAMGYRLYHPPEELAAAEEHGQSAIAPDIVWHIPGFNPLRTVQALGQHLAQDAADSLPAQLFAQAEFAYTNLDAGGDPVIPSISRTQTTAAFVAARETGELARRLLGDC